MRATGITRKIESLGRMVIPKELRDEYDIKEGDKVEFYTVPNGIMVKKYTISCAFCKEENNLVEYNGLKICKACAKKIWKRCANEIK